MEPQIIIFCHPDGKITVETVGFEGSNCIEKTTQLFNELGSVSNVEYKPEYYQDQYLADEVHLSS